MGMTSRRFRLLDALAEEAGAIRRGADPALLDRERELRQRVSAKAARLTRLLDGGRGEAAQAAERDLDGLLADYQAIDERIRTESPNYAGLTRSEPLAVADLQAQLDEGTLLLEYALGPARSYLWAVTRTRVTSYVLPGARTIETAARNAHDLLGKSHEFELGVQARWAAARLSDVVLAPVAGHLGIKRLVVVADGALQYIPFGALPTPGDAARPLILDHEIVSLPSASVLPRLRRPASDRPVADRAVAIFADPVLTVDDPRVEPAGARPARADTARLGTPAHLKRLPFSREEADSIAKLAGPEGAFAATDFAANRAAATGTAITRYRRLHFAAHAVIDTQAPRLSGIVLSQVTRDGSPQDGFLRLHDIYNLRLGADLVTLSACQTALGKDVSGEGLIGLTRGFMYAGAPRVVASVWRVRDRATSELMRRFYDGILTRRLTPAAALRAAQVSMLKEPQWAAPHYWAGFVLHGEWR
jgi:CHAT domain-containing protein